MRLTPSIGYFINSLHVGRIFFNFIEVPFDKLSESGDLIKKLKTGEIHGFVLKNLFSKEKPRK